jgi:hypothetical protein
MQLILTETIVKTMRRLLMVAVSLGLAACGGGGPSHDITGSQPGTGVVNISPQPAYANNSLTAMVIPQGHSTSSAHYSYQWRKNGELIEGASAATLPVGLFHKDDVIIVTVTAIDGPAAGAPISSRPVTISDSAPIVTAVGITPSPLVPQTTVHAVVEGSDVDNDPVVYTYRWYNNGEVIPDQEEETLDGAFVTKGGHIEVEATPSDGGVAGAPRRSPAVTVQNSPPRITSQPTTSLNDSDTYVYQVVAEAPDGGPVTFSLKSAPERMSIDPEHGTIRWRVTKEDVGVHPIEIMATDEVGDSIIQRYDLQIYDLKEKAAVKPDATPPSHS